MWLKHLFSIRNLEAFSLVKQRAIRVGEIWHMTLSFRGIQRETVHLSMKNAEY